MNATRMMRKRFHPMPELTEDLLARMDAKTQAEDSGCIVWTGTTTNGYGQLRVSGFSMSVHRIAFYRGTGVDPKESDVDHTCFNHSCLNPAHLRLATNKQNQENRAGMSKANKSGFRGASWHKRTSKWQAHIKHNGVDKHLGLFSTAAEAGAVAEAERLRLFTHNELDRSAITGKDHHLEGSK